MAPWPARLLDHSFGRRFPGWEVFSIVDIVLALVAAATAAIGISYVTGTELPVPGLRPEVLKWVGVVALTIVLVYLLESDHLGFGVFVALVGAAGMLGGAILAERPDLAGRQHAGIGRELHGCGQFHADRHRRANGHVGFHR